MLWESYSDKWIASFITDSRLRSIKPRNIPWPTCSLSLRSSIITSCHCVNHIKTSREVNSCVAVPTYFVLPPLNGKSSWIITCLAETEDNIIHASVAWLISINTDSRIANRINIYGAGVSEVRTLWNYCGMNNAKCPSKVGTWFLWNCPVDFSQNDSKSRGVITCLFFKLTLWIT